MPEERKVLESRWKPGALVRITQARIGVPRGSIGVIVRSAKGSCGALLHEIQLMSDDLRKILRMERDLEIVQ